MAVSDSDVFPGFLTPVLTQLSSQSHRLLLSHASAKVRGENTPKRNFASTGHRTHNLQVMSPTRSPLSRPDVAANVYNNTADAYMYKITRIILSLRTTQKKMDRRKDFGVLRKQGSIHPSIHPPIHLSTHPPTHPSINPSIHLSIQLLNPLPDDKF